MAEPSFTRAVGRNTIIQFVGKVGSTMLGLVTVAMIQRYLEPSGFGAYTTAMAYLGFFSVLADLGLYVLMVRELAKPDIDPDYVAGNILGLRWASVAVILSLGIGLVFLLPYEPAVRQAVLAGVLAYVAIAATQILVAIYQKHLAMGRVVIGDLASRVIWLIGSWLVIYYAGGLSAFMVVVVVANAMLLAVLWGSARKFISLRPRFDSTYWRYLIKETWPIAVSVVLNLIYFRADTLILAWLRSSYEVGLYGAAYKVLEILNAFPLMFVGLLLPALGVAFAGQDRERFVRLYQRGFSLLAMAALPIVVGGWILAKPILVLIGQEAYAPATPILRLLLIAVAALYMNSLSGHVVTVIGRQRQMVWAYFGVAIVGVAAYLLLIPKYGTTGAAIGTIVTESLTAIVGSIMVLRAMRFGLDFLGLIKIVVAAAAMAAVVWVLRDQALAWPVVAGGAAYIMALVVTRALPTQQLREIFSLRGGGAGDIPTP